MKSVHLGCVLVLAWMLSACTTPAARGTLHPGDMLGAMTITNEESKHFYWIYDLCDFDWTVVEPGSQTVACTVPELAAVGIGPVWAAESSRFEASLAPMTWDLYVDNYKVALDEFGFFDISYRDPGAGFEVTFRNWNVLLRNLTAGRHTLRFSYTLTSTVQDGWATFPPGTYEFIADLTVIERPVYPTLPPVAAPGQHGYASTAVDMDFLLYVPESYGVDPTRQWPLIVYLHDAEWRGTNPDMVATASLPLRLKKDKEFEFLVLSPLGNGDWDFWSTEEMIESVMQVLDEIQSLYAVDPGRIYITGAGMGGNGVWALGMRHPERFAALAPLGGYVYPFGVPEEICQLAEVPVWAFHGEEDFMVPPQVEQDLVNAANACGGSAQITIVTGTVIPLEVYSRSELFDWFLAQSKD